MKQLIIGVLLSLAYFSTKAQQVKTDWTVYAAHSSQPTASQEQLPELTLAQESIEVEGEVTVAKNTAVTFRTLPTGFIHLNSNFNVEQGAFFHAHKADFEPNELETRRTAIDANLEIKLSSYPNPFTDRLFLEFQLPQASKVTINLFDANGRLVQNIATDQFLEAGNQQVEIATTDLVGGIYHVQLIADGQSFQTTLVKVKN